jgi:hypothetical protein
MLSLPLRSITSFFHVGCSSRELASLLLMGGGMRSLLSHEGVGAWDFREDEGLLLLPLPFSSPMFDVDVDVLPLRGLG